MSKLVVILLFFLVSLNFASTFLLTSYSDKKIQGDAIPVTAILYKDNPGGKITFNYQTDDGIKFSAFNALKLVEKKLNKKLIGQSIQIKILKEGSYSHDGISGGLAYYLLIYSVLSGKEFRTDYVFSGTGALTESGSIMPVVATNPKIRAAQNGKATMFFLPYYENLREPIAYDRFNIKLIEVYDVDEAVQIVFAEPKTLIPSFKRDFTNKKNYETPQHDKEYLELITQYLPKVKAYYEKNKQKNAATKDFEQLILQSESNSKPHKYFNSLLTLMEAQVLSQLNYLTTEKKIDLKLLNKMIVESKKKKVELLAGYKKKKIVDEELKYLISVADYHIKNTEIYYAIKKQGIQNAFIAKDEYAQELSSITELKLTLLLTEKLLKNK